MDVYIGCCGWYYLRWKGLFYPEDLPTSKWFGFYASKFNSVEINSSYYRMPKERNVKTWLRNAKRFGGEDFIYSVKMNKIITHVAKLDLNQCSSELDQFLQAVFYLEDRLGCILVQLPPSFKPDNQRIDQVIQFFNYLNDKLEHHSNENLLTRKVDVAIEFRHKDWFQDDLLEELSESSFIIVSVDAPRKTKIPFIIKGNRFLYLRLHGHHEDKWYRYNYSEQELNEIKEKIEHINKTKDVERCYIYFDNDFNAWAPRNAMILKKSFVV
ncbi:MAG: DUF72 domain-containing protein [Promethearchaeota archaeon]